MRNEVGFVLDQEERPGLSLILDGEGHGDERDGWASLFLVLREGRHGINVLVGRRFALGPNLGTGDGMSAWALRGPESEGRVWSLLGRETRRETGLS